MLFAAIVVAALLGVFGQTPVTSTASTNGAMLSVRAPDRTRGGVIYQARIRIDARTPLHHARLLLDPAWLEGVTLNSFEPSASTEGEQDGKLMFDLGPLHAGDSETLYLELQINPTTVGTRSQDVELEDGDTPVTSIHRTMTVFP